MPIEKLLKNIKGNSFVMERVKELVGEGGNPSEPELMGYYRSFLLGALKEAGSAGPGMDVGRRRIMLDQMAMNIALAMEVQRAMDAAKTFDRYAIPESEAVHMFKGAYFQWLHAELEEVIKVSVTLGVDEVTHTGVRKEVMAGLIDLDSLVDKTNAVHMMLERTKVDKTALKKEVREFLNIDKFSVFGTLRNLRNKAKGTVTADLLDQLRDEMARLDREILNLETLNEWPLSYRENWRRKLVQRKETALGYCLLLRERKIDKDSTTSSLKALTAQATGDYAALSKKFAEQSKQFIKGIEDIGAAIKLHEKWIEDGVARLRTLEKSIEATATKVFQEDELIEEINLSLKRAQNRISDITRKHAEVTEQKRVLDERAAAMKDWKYAPYGVEDEARKKSSQADARLIKLSQKMRDTEGKAGALQKRLDAHQEARKKWQTQLDSQRSKVPVIVTDLCLLGTRYDTIRSCVETVGEEQRAVELERKRIEQEIEWLRKVPVIDRSLRIYATFSNVSFKLLLAIGKLVSGAHCGPIGPITVNALACAELIQTAISAKGVMAAPAMATSMVGMVASNAVLSRICAYDTGSFRFSIVLGLSGGVSAHCTEFTGGLALVYNAGFDVGDDRRFSTVCTLKVEMVGEVNISEVLKAELKAVVIENTTSMIFQDVYHWAAWLGQRWANVAAMVRGSKFFNITDKWGMPDEIQRQHMLDVAAISLANDPKYEIIKDTMKYLNAPLIRMTSSELASELEGKVSGLGVLEVGAGITRTSEPLYYRQFPATSRVTGKPMVIEKTKKGEQKSRTVSLGTPIAGFSATYNYSNIEKHVNVDNQGIYHGLSFSLGGADEKAGFSHVPDASQGVRVTKWVKDYLEPIADKAKHISGEIQQLFKSVQESSRLRYFEEITGTLSLINAEMVFQRLEVTRKGPPPKGKSLKDGDKESEICLLYARPVVKKSFDAAAKFPTGVPGLLIDLGIGASLKRTYNEVLGTNTFGYVATVFNGLMNISDYDTKEADNPRPKEAWGTTLWEEWTAAHDSNLLQMLKNVALDHHASPVRWITKEVLDNAEGKRFAQSLQKDYAGRIAGMTKLNDDLKMRLRGYLNALRKEQELKEKANPDWIEREPKLEFTFSIIELPREIYRSRTQLYKIDKALKSIGPRRGVKEIMEEHYQADLVVHQKDNWVPDEYAGYCTGCLTPFTMTTRKHHCRECGQIFCSKCLPHTMPLPHRGYKTPEKVCEPCFQKVTAWQQGTRPKLPKLTKITESQEFFYPPGVEAQGGSGDLWDWVIVDPKHESLEEWTVLSETPWEQPKPKNFWTGGHPTKKTARLDLFAKGAASVKKPEASPVPTSSAAEQTPPPSSVTEEKVPPPSSVPEEKSPPPASPVEDPIPPPTSPAAASAPVVVPELDTRFTAMDVARDGNCLFRSISLALTGSENSHADLRRSALALMRCFEVGVMNSLQKEGASDLVRPDVQDIMKTPAQAFENYLKHMAKDGVWGGSPELRALANLLRRNIIVHIQGQTYFIPFGEEADVRFTPLPGLDPIHLLYVGGGHYECFRLKTAQFPPQQQVYPHIVGYHGTSAHFRESIAAGLKAGTGQVWGEGGELGPGFYITRDYPTAHTYGEAAKQKLSLAGTHNPTVDVWEVRSMMPLGAMQGQAIGKDHMWGNDIEMVEWMNHNHYFYNALEAVSGSEISQYKFNPWAYGFLKVTLS